MSLDTVIDKTSASQALELALSYNPLGKLVVRYLALFRPAKSKLSWARVATLLGELMPAIESQRILRDGKAHEAPHEVWCAAIEQVLLARENGKLQTPLKTHGYLYSVIVSESSKTQGAGLVVASGREAQTQVMRQPNKQLSGTAQAVTLLEQRKRGQS